MNLAMLADLIPECDKNFSVLAVYVLILDDMHRKKGPNYGWSWPSIQRLCRRSGLSRSSVTAAQRLIREKGWLYCERRKLANGRDTSTRWWCCGRLPPGLLERLGDGSGRPDPMLNDGSGRPDGEGPAGRTHLDKGLDHLRIDPIYGGEIEADPTADHGMPSPGSDPTNGNGHGATHQNGRKRGQPPPQATLNLEVDPVPRSEVHSTSDRLFEEAWEAYPQREGSNSKSAAREAWRARVKQGEDPRVMLDGTKRYADYCTVVRREPRYIMQASRFYGPKREYEATWDLKGPPPGVTSTAWEEICHEPNWI